MKTRPKVTPATLHKGLVDGRFQIVRTAPLFVLVGKYTTKSGQIKNKYAVNPESKELKIIKHH